MASNVKTTKTIGANQTDMAKYEACLKEGKTQEACKLIYAGCRGEAETVFDKCNELKETASLNCYTTSTSGDTCDYKNQYMQTSASELQGGHGGVVITW